MLPRPQECRGCALDSLASGFTRPEGTGSLGVAIVGEAAGAHEAADGLPFRPAAPAGSVLERVIRLAGFSRSQFVIWNVVQCHPPRDWLDGAPYEYDAVRHCAVHRARNRAKFRPKVILALGNIALRALTEQSGSARDSQGITDLRGFPLPAAGQSEMTEEPIWVIPTYHPSFLRRGKKAGQDGGMGLMGVLIHDLMRAVEVARHGYDPGDDEYVLAPSAAQIQELFRSVQQNPSLTVAYDIETPRSAGTEEDEREHDATYQIESVQIATAPHGGMFFDGDDPAQMEAVKAILALPNPKVGHNAWFYDNPRLVANGFTLNGQLDDTMWAWHHMQPDLRAGLQFVASFYASSIGPWKHLSGSEPRVYGCRDVDALQQIWPPIQAALKSKGLWDGYAGLVREFQPILVDMSKRGIPVDDVARMRLREELTIERDAVGDKLRKVYPVELCSVSPKNGYLRTPRDTAGMVERDFDVPEVTTLDGLVVNKVKRWCRLELFSPNSSPQILRYMRAKGHPVPTAFKTGQDTTETDALVRLAKSTKDSFYSQVLDFRRASKAISTYTDGWEPGMDGCVHPQYSFRPATGQLSSHSPNVQNFPAKAALAERMKAMIAPRPGYRIVNLDYKSFHALTLGFEAQDADYMRAARLDIHSLVSGEVLGVHKAEKLWVKTDEELAEYFTWYKSDPVRKTHRDIKAKPSLLGIGYGLQARKLYLMNQDSFSSEADARKVRRVIEGMFPKVFLWQTRIRRLAHQQGYLTSRWGFIRWFWEVLRWDANRVNAGGVRGDWIAGDDSEAAIAFLPANDAFGHIRSAMLEVERQGLAERFGLVNTVHDSLVFHCSEGLAEECAERVGTIMRAPSAVLVDPVTAPSGLVCDVGITIMGGALKC